tara:strand:+ start:163 stop:324 length:162 start_codon:yes stop_codon:yes gene_type:complete
MQILLALAILLVVIGSDPQDEQDLIPSTKYERCLIMYGETREENTKCNWNGIK